MGAIILFVLGMAAAGAGVWILVIGRKDRGFEYWLCMSAEFLIALISFFLGAVKMMY